MRLLRITRVCLPDSPATIPPSPPDALPGGRPASALSPERTTTRELMGGRGELIIVHEGREYTLRITRNGKLILTA
jgi:hemin uptake protein HemP